MPFLSFDKDFVSSERQKDLRNMLQELLELDEGLSNWEMNFLDSLNNWEWNFTQNQADKLEEIWNKHF